MSNSDNTKNIEATTNIETKTFGSLIGEHQIRIPQIQRDYAQGRMNKEVSEIRDSFVRSLMWVVTGKKSETELDFIYGSERDNAFEPLDGQQRLTTLFLLNWVLGVNLKNAKGEAALTYATRNTSEAFCKELVKHSARQFVDESSAKKDCKPSDIIKGRDWFQWSWKYDPTIASMLTMIDAICAEMDWSADMEECRKRLDNIKFNYLDLGKLGMSDELFIKMNARGKLLSDFDKLKSTLEEEIQMLQTEAGPDGKKLADASVENDWRTYMDGVWIDLFWQQNAGEIMALPPDNDEVKALQLAAAKETESRLKLFVLRMIAMQIFAKMPGVSGAVQGEAPAIDDDAEKKRYSDLLNRVENIYEATYQLKGDNIDNLILQYQNQLINWRGDTASESLPAYCVAVDFAQLIKDINHWIVDKGNGKYTDVSALLPREAYFDDTEETYFQRLSSYDPGNDVIAILFSISRYLRLFPYKDKSSEWLSNFDEWVRFSRNIFKNDNNNARIDKRRRLAESFSGIEEITGELQRFVESEQKDINIDDTTVVAFIKSRDRNYKGIDNQSLAEEKHKATLRMPGDKIDSDWTESIRKAEKIKYFWGQIRFLYVWAKDDRELFDRYVDCFLKWDNISTEWNQKEQEKYYTALLCMQPDCWQANNSLYEFNRDRDNSVKRYLRDEQLNNGIFIKNFMDRWIEWNKDATFEEFCNYLITSTNNTGWVNYLKQKPYLIWQSWRKKIDQQKGHVIFYQQKTSDSHCFDVVINYLYYWLYYDMFYDSAKKGRQPKDGYEIELYDSKSLGSYGLRLSREGFHTWELRWGENDGEYVLTEDGATPQSYDMDGIVSEIKRIAQDLQERDAEAEVKE